MEKENNRILIQEHYSTDTIEIYWRERQGNRECWYSFNGDTLVETTIESVGYRPVEIKPFLSFPSRIGKIFLSLLDIEINNMGINTRKEDMKSGKIEILEQELAFNKEQFVKLINHLTK